MRNVKIIPITEEKILFIGKETLNIKEGSIVRVTASEMNNDEILIRTNSDERPFVNLQNGTLWYNSIDSYSFEIIKNQINLQIQK